MSNFWDERQLLVTITTVSSDWRDKINEVNNLGLTKVALFLTGLAYQKIPKKTFFDLIDNSCIKEVPFAHICETTSPEDIEFLKRRFNTRIFNHHSESEFPLEYDLSKYKKEIYLETLFKYSLKEDEVKKFAGICIDVSHMEIAKVKNLKVFEENSKIIEKFKVGCNHISAYKENAIEKASKIKKSSHYFTELSQFDYLLKYPNHYYSNMMALELENTIEDQLKAKEYVINLLKNR
jgi:hypothetical protein